MKVLVLTSSSLRHLYFLEMIRLNFNLVGAIVEEKGNYYSYQENNSKFIKDHFKKLKETEKIFFSTKLDKFNFKNINLKKINKGYINTDKILNWSKKLKPDFIFLFGTSILNEKWLNLFKDKIINLHLGLSPFYKGSATLFWPFVNGELECIGATIHLATKQVDSGSIIGRIKPDISKKDNYYLLNFKTIKCSIESFPHIVKEYIAGERKLINQFSIPERIYKKKDFNEESLRDVLKQYGKFISEEKINQIKMSKKCKFYQ